MPDRYLLERVEVEHLDTRGISPGRLSRVSGDDVLLPLSRIAEDRQRTRGVLEELALLLGRVGDGRKHALCSIQGFVALVQLVEGEDVPSCGQKCLVVVTGVFLVEGRQIV